MQLLPQKNKNYIGKLETQTYEIFKNTLDVNLVAPFYLTKKLVHFMKNQKSKYNKHFLFIL